MHGILKTRVQLKLVVWSDFKSFTAYLPQFSPVSFYTVKTCSLVDPERLDGIIVMVVIFPVLLFIIYYLYLFPCQSKIMADGMSGWN